MNNVIANLEGSILTLKIDLAKSAKPGKTNGVLIHAQNQKFETIGHLKGREIGLGNLFITSRPDPSLPRPEIKKSVSTPEPKKVLAPAKKPESKPEPKTPAPAQTNINPFHLSV